jgi:hypothetical protein
VKASRREDQILRLAYRDAVTAADFEAWGASRWGQNAYEPARPPASLLVPRSQG